MGCGISNNKPSSEKKSKKTKKKEKFYFQIVTNIHIRTAINVCQLSNDRLGILFDFYLLILYLKTIKQIDKIELNLKNLSPSNRKLLEALKKGINIPRKRENRERFEYEENRNGYEYIKNLIELKNNDIAIWSNQKLYLYNISNKKYKLYQIIEDTDSRLNLSH